jgi:hypothetical protein
MLRVEATIRDDDQIPFSIAWAGTDRISPERHPRGRQSASRHARRAVASIALDNDHGLIVDAILFAILSQSFVSFQGVLHQGVADFLRR